MVRIHAWGQVLFQENKPALRKDVEEEVAKMAVVAAESAARPAE